MKAGPISVAKPLLTLLLSVALIFTSPLALAKEEKIVYHLHNIQPNTFKRAINNLENLQYGLAGSHLDIKLLMQGNSIRLLFPSRQNESLMPRFLKLVNSGVDIEISRQNLMRHASLIKRSLKPKLVDNILSRVVELQKQGYRYITP